MSRSARTLSALVALVCCLAPAVVTPAQAAPARAGPDEHRRAGVARAAAREPVAPGPQPVSIETLSPVRLRPGDPVTVTGTVLNNTDEVWGDVQVGMLTQPFPFTRQREIAAAVRAGSEEFVRQTIVAPGTFDDIGDVAPGQARSYAFTVPFQALDVDGSEGVYWVGVEVRAFDGEGLRGPVADTYTFMPLVTGGRQAPTVDLAFLWPVTARVPWNGEEFIDASLTDALSPGARLRTLTEVGASAEDTPVTWVVDPAVLDAARAMSDGFSLLGREVGQNEPEATSAAQWLDLVVDAIGSSVALSVPYGHPDVATLAHADIRSGLRRARRAAERVLDSLEINRLSLAWPARGRADRRVLQAAAEFDPSLALLARTTFTDQPGGSVVGLRTPAPENGTTTRPSDTWQGLVVDGDRSRRGLRAQPGQTVLEWRQLILANTALRALDGGPVESTAIAMPSSHWWPDDDWRSADLFDSLEVPWINTVEIGDLTDGATQEYRGRFEYPPRLRRRELRAGILNDVRRLRRSARIVGNLLNTPEPHTRQTDKEFGLATSVGWREDRSTGDDLVTDFVAANRAVIDGIELDAPEFVTLSSEAGRFPISLTNQLDDQTVTVGLSVTARTPQMSIAPIQEVTLQPNQRVTVTVATTSRGIGITTATARLVTQGEQPFGRAESFQVRTTQIGAVVWVIMAIGGAVLFIAAGRRIVLRVRNHRRASRRPG